MDLLLFKSVYISGGGAATPLRHGFLYVHGERDSGVFRKKNNYFDI